MGPLPHLLHCELSLWVTYYTSMPVNSVSPRMLRDEALPTAKENPLLD